MKKDALSRLLLVCMGAFVCCILATGAPLARLAGTTLLAALPTSLFLILVGTKLPADLHLTADIHASQVNTNALEFLFLTMLASLFYALSAYLARRYVERQPTPTTKRRQPAQILLRLIWLVALLLGVAYVLMPALLSRDALVYAGYGRIVVAYHANPYYTPLSAFPHDPLLQADDWRDALAAYGPLWLLVCALSTLFAGSSVLQYIFFYRALGLIAHLLNIALVTTILRKTGRSSRTIIAGTLLYAWNPLVLLESCMGGHNDILLVSCILLGILLCVRAEQTAFATVRSYLPPLLAFTCAALIKFTAAPLLAFYLVLLTRRTLSAQPPSQRSTSLWLPVVRKVAIATLTSTLLAVTLYTPLWVGHTVHAIVASLGSPPSSRLAFGSTLLALQKVAVQHPENMLLATISQHGTWNGLTGAIVGIVFCAGAFWLWRVPTLPTMVYATLATLGVLLVVTPWFFPWYVLWLVALAAVAPPERSNRVGQALVWSTLTFSTTAFFLYLFRGYPPVGDWIGFTSLTTIGPPLLVFLSVLCLTPRQANKPLKQAISQPVP